MSLTLAFPNIDSFMSGSKEPSITVLTASIKS
jgi:hypothetical protein